MKIILSSRRRHYVARVSIFLIMVALIAGMVGCGGAPAVTEYDLTISSTTGGSVTTPGEGTDTYDEGEVVNLVATPDAGYHFVNWTGDVSTIGNVDAAITTIVMNGDYSIAAEFATPKNIWLSGLITNLEDDTTDENEYIVNVYDDENFAKDLEDNLEELDYDVTFLTVFEFDGTLLWVPLLKIRYSEDFAVLVNPRTDDIVTEAYDGDGDGATETLVGMNLTEVSSWLYELVSTGLGNDGQYLILGFDDYDTVELADTTVGKNITDLKKDLAANNISKRTWVPGTYDCDDFARDLEDDLEALGYNVTIKLVYWWAWNGTAWKWCGHAVVNVHLDGGVVVTIEPQNDQDVTAVYDGDGDGTVETVDSPPRIVGMILLLEFHLELRGGTDGGKMILEYEDFDDIPFPLD